MAQVAPVVVPTKRTFKKLHLHLREMIKQVNTDAAALDFADLVATVDSANSQVTLNLVETPVNRVMLAEPIVLTYTLSSFEDFVRNDLGFRGTYEVKQKDQVIAALPDGFTTEWNETNKTLKVKVAATTSNVEFKETSATLASALFSTSEMTIQFADDIIDIAEKITVKTLGQVDAATLLEPVAPAVTS